MGPLHCYGQFCCEIPEAIEKVKRCCHILRVANEHLQLKELESKPATQKILEQAKKDSGQRFPLKDLLNVPMQRILKYPLLIKVS